MIYINTEKNAFHLSGKSFSYCLYTDAKGNLFNLYWGERIPDSDISRLLGDYREAASFDLVEGRLPWELPAFGAGYSYEGAIEAVNFNGDAILCLKYAGYRLEKGKPALEGLPSSCADDTAETLVICLEDELTGLQTELMYTVFEGMDVLARSMKVINRGQDTLLLKRMLSCSVPMWGCDYDMLHLNGGHARERRPERHHLNSAISQIESRRGASGHEENPFIALLEPTTTEFRGQVWAATFVYSGSFMAQVSVNNCNNARLSMGLNPDVCSWTLETGEAFQTPEVLLTYSGEGLNGMSHANHDFIRKHIIRGEWQRKPRPVLVNNWEGTYFNFDEDKLIAIAEAGAELGVELFVLDDGWFGKRNSDNCSLGDWYVNTEKLPHGIKGVSDRVHALGMLFGLWFEPEMISPDSDLYRAHPDWCLHAKGRARTEARQQLILDLSRRDVQDYIIKTISDILARDGVDYVKWDMNRNMTEPYSALLPAGRQSEVQHRYMLGLYRVYDEIMKAFPKVLFEGCSGGGGRFDLGTLCYMPQIWTSDDTDAVERLGIQYGTSIVYPAAAMGAHLSAVPNHQTTRVTDFEMRANVALAGNFGFELDLTRFTDEEKRQAAEAVSRIKRLRGTLQQGEFTRLESPFEGNYTAWQFISEDRQQVIFCAYKLMEQPNLPVHRVRLAGLERGAVYEANGRAYTGGELMSIGFTLPDSRGDFKSFVVEFTKQ